MVEPLRPEDVDVPRVLFPDFVIGAINILIARHWNGESAEFDICLVKEEILGPGNDGRWENWWLDFEEVYRAAGWIVKYDDLCRRYTFKKSP